MKNLAATRFVILTAAFLVAGIATSRSQTNAPDRKPEVEIDRERAIQNMRQKLRLTPRVTS